MVKLFVAIALSMLSARPMNRTMPRLALCALALMAAVPAAAQNTAPYSVAESGRGYGSLQAAVDAIGNAVAILVVTIPAAIGVAALIAVVLCCVRRRVCLSPG